MISYLIFSKNFNLKVLNAGIGGQTSFGHKKMFDLWFSRHQELKPKFVIVYLGINDSLYLIDKLNLNKKNFLEGRSLNNSNRDNLYRIGKLDNLIGVLDWDIQSTETSNTFNKLFEF